MSDNTRTVNVPALDPESPPDVQMASSNAGGRNAGLGTVPEQSDKQMGTGELTVLPKRSDTSGEAEQVILQEEEAEPMFREVLTSREKPLGKEDPLTVTNMHDLALSLFQQQKFGEAEPLFREVLTSREKLLSKEDPLTVTSMHDLALSLDL